MRSTTEIRVRGYHIDVFGHVNHARYVEFLEEARWDFFDQHGPVVERLHTRGIVHAVVKLELNYLHGAKVGDCLRIDTSITEVGQSSVIMGQEIYRTNSEKIIASAKITNAFLDQQTGRPVSIRDEMLPLQSAFSLSE
jgi:thioesterase-3